MRRTCKWTLGAFLVLGLLVHGGNSRAEESSAGFAVVCPVSGEIADGPAVLVKRAVEKESAGASVLVFVIDTFGGRVDSAIEIAELIGKAPCPSIAYVTGKGAISAGALITYACDQIIMAPGANIGASTPIQPGANVSEQVTEKSMSFLRAKYRALGELNGHNPLLGEAMVDAGIELRGWPRPEGGFTIVKVSESRVEEQSISTPDVPPAPHPIDTLFEILGGDDPATRPVRDALKEMAPSPTPNPVPETPPTGVVKKPAQTPPLINLADIPVDARVISPAGKLLTLTTQEAITLGLAKAEATSVDQALAVAGWANLRRVTLTMRWDESLFAFLTTPLIAGLLLMCGVAGIYLELKAPGIGWAGAVGAVCLAIFFGSRFVVGMADWLDIALVVVGIGLVALEIFVIPGFGAAGVCGLLCLFMGIYLALTRVPVPQYTWDYTRLTDAGITLLVSSVALTAFILFTWWYFPKTSLARGLMQPHVQLASAGYSVQSKEEARLAVGHRGVAVTMLRPAGRGRFGADTLDVMTEGDFIEPGLSIEIIQAEGNRYVVREVKADL